MTFNSQTADYAPGFVPTNLVVVGEKTDRGEKVPVVVYQNEFKGKKYFHLRALWHDDKSDTWNVGKGLSFPADEAAVIFAEIGKLVTPVAVPSTAPKRKVKTA